MFTVRCSAYFFPPAPFPVLTGVVGEYAVSGILFHGVIPDFFCDNDSPFPAGCSVPIIKTGRTSLLLLHLYRHFHCCDLFCLYSSFPFRQESRITFYLDYYCYSNPSKISPNVIFICGNSFKTISCSAL